MGGPHGLDHASLTYAGNTAEQAGYLGAGGLGGLAGIGPYGSGIICFTFFILLRDVFKTMCKGMLKIRFFSMFPRF